MKTAKFQNRQLIYVEGKGYGKVTGYVGYSSPLTTVRVQFNSGEIIDYDQDKLCKLNTCETLI